MSSSSEFDEEELKRQLKDELDAMSYDPAEDPEDENDEFEQYELEEKKKAEDPTIKALQMIEQGILKGKGDLDLMVEQILN